MLPALESLGLERGSQRLQLTKQWISRLHFLLGRHRNDATQTAFEAIARLPLAHQAPLLRDLLAEISATPWERIEPRIVRAAFDAVARVTDGQEREALLSDLSGVIPAVAPGDPEATGDSERRAFMRTLRAAIAELPNMRQPLPLGSLASQLALLPERERHLEMDLLLRQLTRLASTPTPAGQLAASLEKLVGQIAHLELASRGAAWNAARGMALAIGRAGNVEPWKALMDQIEHMEPRRRPGMLTGVHAQIARLPSLDERARLLPALLPVHRLAREAERDTHFVRGFRWTRALPLEHREDALCALAHSIRDLTPGNFARATEQLARAVTADARPRRNAAFDALVEAAGGLALTGLPQGFDILRGAIDALAHERRAPLLVALAEGVEHWPPAGQTDRFVELVNASLDHRPATQGHVLAALSDRVESLPPHERETFMSFALAMSAELPPILRGRPLDRLANSLDELAADEQAPFALRLVAAVVAMPEAFRTDAFHQTVATFAELTTNDRWVESFEPLVAAVADEPLAQRPALLSELIQGVTLWPADDQPRYFAALRAQLMRLRNTDRAELLGDLADRIDSLSEAARRAEEIALRAAIASLPPALRRGPMNALLAALDEH